MYVDRSRFLTRLLMVFCVCVWCLVVFQINAFAGRYDVVIEPSNVYTSVPTVGMYIPAVNSGYYIVTSVGPVNYDTSPGGWSSWTISYCKSSGCSSSYHPSTTTGLVRYIIYKNREASPGLYYLDSQLVYIQYDTQPPNLPQDSDGDGTFDDVDPCPNSSDQNFRVYRARNMCTGSYYFYQITGDCGETNTFANPIYNSLSSALEDSLANPECSPPESFQSASMTAEQFETWYNTNFDTQSSAESGLTDQSIPDPTGGNSTSYRQPEPKPVDASDPDNQKVIDQIERMKVAVENAVRGSGDKVASQVDISGKDIVGALKGVKDGIAGISFAGVSNAIGSASATAHGDAQALLSAVESMSNKIGTPSNSSTSVNFDGLTKDELVSETDRIYSADGGVGYESSAPGLSNSLLAMLQNWVTTLKNYMANALPEASVSTISPTPCLSYNGNIVDASGNTYVLTDYCFDDWEGSISMIGSVLLGLVSIGCFLSVFRMRG